YDTYIDEEQLQVCDQTVHLIADELDPRPYSSREFISEMGKYLTQNARKKTSLVQTAYENDVPIFCPAFSDSSAGFGLVLHQFNRPDKHVSIDSVKDFLELTQIKMQAPTSGLLMIGGGVPKNFAQDTVICAEVLGKEVPMHRYAIQITVADVRGLWPQVLDEVKRRRRFAWMLLSQNAQVLDVANGVLVLGFANSGARDNFLSGGSQDVLRDCLVEVMGADLRIDPIIDGSGTRGGPPPRQAGSSRPSGPGNTPQPTPVQAEPEPTPDDIDPDADVTLDGSAASASELIASELGARIIDEEVH
ncbi:MAG TPA: deoxyhypusine synthase family protein, partial [Dermatophilaceae bacterium]|nr:deoxyhypusine synthase family protein [Dermatophilaceae bacterium]